MENMEKYVVICYAVHEEKIERYKTFDNKKDAYIFVKDIAFPLSFSYINKIYINKKVIIQMMIGMQRLILHVEMMV